MKIGTCVAVCHDGKWGRREKGEVIATRNGHHIKVRFISPADHKTHVEFWARKIPKTRWRYARFGGWADVDWWSPWFSVERWKD